VYTDFVNRLQLRSNPVHLLLPSMMVSGIRKLVIVDRDVEFTWTNEWILASAFSISEGIMHRRYTIVRDNSFFGVSSRGVLEVNCDGRDSFGMGKKLKFADLPRRLYKDRLVQSSHGPFPAVQVVG